MQHIITATAYERKPELGGGFRGVLLDKRNKERAESPVLPTIEAARYWARTQIQRLLGSQPYRTGYVYRPDWVMNVFVGR